MVHIGHDEAHGECLHLPRAAVRPPILFRPQPGFDPANLATWPRLDGRLEYVEGRIQFMPPCGRVQQDVCVDVTLVLGSWTRAHPEFVLGTNEAGMLLADEVRGADAAVWRSAEVGPSRHELARVPPVLAVEVGGRDEGEAELRDKATWYLEVGVAVVWLVLPDSREVLVLCGTSEQRCRPPERLPLHPALPGLAPEVGEFFRQLDR